MAIATIFVPAPVLVEVVSGKVLLRAVAPCYEVPPILRRQEDAVGLVVGGKNYPDAVEDAVLARFFSSTRSTSGGAAVYAFMWS